MASHHQEYLDIVNEHDEIIGKDTRDTIHRDGLLHREIHIWFITPNHEIILQHRAKDKDTYPDLLDATVGGHVDSGMTYEDTAIKELAEETGIIATIRKLIPLEKMRVTTVDGVTNTINNTFRMQYAYVYTGDIEDLHIEKGKAIGFESWPIAKMSHLSASEKTKFIPLFYSKEYLDLYNQIRTLIS